MKVRTYQALTGVLMSLLIHTESWADDKKRDVREGQIVFLNDLAAPSGMGQPPETLRAAMQSSLDALRLADRSVGVATLLYGDSDVTVIGDQDGLPDSALPSLRQKLQKAWRKPAGKRPLDEALQEIIRIESKAPADWELMLIHACSGGADSGRIRPDAFPEVKRRVEELLEQKRRQLKGYSPEFVAEALAQLQREIEDPTTETFKDLYAIQHPLELKHVLTFADALKKAGIRLVTLNLARTSEDIRAVEELHRACGGKDETLVRTTPDRVFDILNGLVPQLGPGIRQLKDINVPAAPDSFEAQVEVLIEKLSSAADISVVFEPAIAEFSNKVRFTATVDGSEYQFDLNDDASSETHLYTDAEGNVCGARLRLTAVPASGKVVLKLESPDASLHMPKMKIRTSVRLAGNVSPRFRPLHSDPSARPTFTVSPKSSTRWAFSLVNLEDSRSYAIDSVEITLRDPYASREVLLSFSEDDTEVDLWVTAPVQIPAGTFDAHCVVRMPSSTELRFVIPEAVKSIDALEIVTFEIPQPVGDDEDIQGSFSRSHLDFGVLGDRTRQRTLDLTLRLRGSVKHPVPVVLDAMIADCDGLVPSTQLIRFSRKSLTLLPARKEIVRVTVELPERFESSISEGVFTGQIVCTRADSGQVLVVERFEEIHGVPSDAPVDLLTFEWLPPRVELSLPRAFRQWIVPSPQEQNIGHVRVDVIQPYARSVPLTVTNHSEVSRSLVIAPFAICYDEDRKRVPSVRLVEESGTTTFDFEAGETRIIRFRFEIDGDCPAETIHTGIDCHGDGVQQYVLPIVVHRRREMLADSIRTVLYGLAIFAGLLSLRAMTRRMRSRRQRTGQTGIVTDRNRRDDFSLSTSGQGCRLLAERDLLITSAEQSTPRRLNAGYSRKLESESVSEDRPLTVQAADDADAPVVKIELIECEPDESVEAHFVMAEGGRHDRVTAQAGRSFRRCAAVLGLCVYAGSSIHEPLVARVFQWLIDAVLYV